MKKMFQYLIAVVALSGLTTFAATATYEPTSVGITSVIPNKSIAITSIQFANSDTGAVTVALFNAPTNVLTFSIGAYTNNVVSVGDTVVTYTNILGTVQSQTNRTITTTATPVSATTGNYQKLLTYVIPGSSTVNLPFTPALQALNGLAATNSATNIVLTIQYQNAN